MNEAVLNSTHKVEVTRISLGPHPNADTLSIARIFSGYYCVVKTSDWQDGQLGAYIPPDSVVDATRPEFAFLAGHTRIRVKRLRGVISMGLLMPVPISAREGDDLAEYFGVKHYDPPLFMSTGGEAESPPSGYHPVFDVDSLRRYAHVFNQGEPVFISEKIHGASARYVWHDNRMYCGSRTEWKRQDEKNLWWQALQATPVIEEFCSLHPEITIYAEVYGQVQDLRYGAQKNEVKIAVFDLLCGPDWLPVREARTIGECLPFVPIIAEAIPFDLTSILTFAEGPSLILGANCVREGIVVKPLRERIHPEIGRVCCKVVGNGYLERA